MAIKKKVKLTAFQKAKAAIDEDRMTVESDLTESQKGENAAAEAMNPVIPTANKITRKVNQYMAGKKVAENDPTEADKEETRKLIAMEDAMSDEEFTAFMEAKRKRRQALSQGTTKGL